MPPMYGNTSSAYRLFCTACRRHHELSWPDVERYVKAGRAYETDLSGSLGRPREWYTVECDDCFRTNRQRRREVPDQMAAIRRHQLEIESRGVLRDEAIASAVEREMTYAEITLSTEFVAQVHGLDKPSRAREIVVEHDHETEAVKTLKALPWAEPAPDVTSLVATVCHEDGCTDNDTLYRCEVCRHWHCKRHLVLVFGINGTRPLCRVCRAALMED